MATYTASSPYYKTSTVEGQYLDTLQIRPVPAESDDVLYVVEVQYTHRPDLLAYDLYGDKGLWWVFAQRNMDIIKDPVYDIEAGIEIYIPKGERLQQVLGL